MMIWNDKLVYIASTVSNPENMMFYTFSTFPLLSIYPTKYKHWIIYTLFQRGYYTLLDNRKFFFTFDFKTMSKIDVVMGSQWGDEGKGKLVDTIGDQYSSICLFHRVDMIFVVVLLEVPMPDTLSFTKERLLPFILFPLVSFNPKPNVLSVTVVLLIFSLSLRKLKISREFKFLLRIGMCL